MDLDAGIKRLMRTASEDPERHLIELEIRVGVMRDGVFDTNVGKFAFEEIKRQFDERRWRRVVDTELTDHAFTDGLRVTTNTRGEVVDCVHKTLIAKETHDMLRCSLSYERPSAVPENSHHGATTHRHKHRVSYHSENAVRFDLTVIEQRNGTRVDNRYEVEVEIECARNMAHADLDRVIRRMSRIAEIVRMNQPAGTMDEPPPKRQCVSFRKCIQTSIENRDLDQP